MNTDQLIAAATETLREMDAGKVTDAQASVRFRGLREITRMLALRLEHARLTGRLKNGDGRLPDMAWGTDAVAPVSNGEIPDRRAARP